MQEPLSVVSTVVAPTILRKRGYRFFFFSREEPRAHIHVSCADGEAKYWLDSNVELARNHRLAASQLRVVEGIIEEHLNEFRAAWTEHFGR